jgi:hypothetical protein
MRGAKRRILSRAGRDKRRFTRPEGRKLKSSGGGPRGSRQARRSRHAAAQERSVFVPRKTRLQTDEWAGLLASGSSYRPHLPAPMAAERTRQPRCSGQLRLSSPVTAAGPRRIRTVFPILPPKLRVPGDTHVVGHRISRARKVNEPTSGRMKAEGRRMKDEPNQGGRRPRVRLILHPSSFRLPLATLCAPFVAR